MFIIGHTSNTHDVSSCKSQNFMSVLVETLLWLWPLLIMCGNLWLNPSLCWPPLPNRLQPKLALYDRSCGCAVQEELSLSWKSEFAFPRSTFDVKDTKYVFGKLRGCCRLHSLWSTLAFMKLWNRSKSGTSIACEAFYKDEMSEHSGACSLMVVKVSQSTKLSLDDRWAMGL